jgi:uroporphyrinogen-III decarboxylase
MCQLSLGHYFLRSGLDPVEIWYDSPAFGEALLSLQRRYGFDGILVNLPGRNPAWRSRIVSTVARDGGIEIRWRGGVTSFVPGDDNPHVFAEGGQPRRAVAPGEIEPEALYYVEPHAPAGPEYPGGRGFPPWQYDTIRYVRDRAPDVSVHGEVFSPFSQWLELVDYEQGLMALRTDPARVLDCLDRLVDGTVALACGQAAAGVDAVLISSAFAGGRFLSPRHYERFVLPCESRVIDGIRRAWPDLAVYTHTCGAIGDRLELMMRTGTGGIDTLDPPPLGTVELADAKTRLGTRAFIKGNLDPVNTLLLGNEAECRAAALGCLAAAKAGGGYILSSACSVAPHTPPANLLGLRAAIEQAGVYAGPYCHPPANSGH